MLFKSPCGVRLTVGLSVRIVGFLPIFLWGTIVSGASYGDSLHQILKYAYDTNPQLVAQRYQVQATNEAYHQAYAARLPVITAEGRASWVYTSSETNFGHRESESTPLSATLTITQPLYRGGAITANISGAESRARAAWARLSALEQSIFAQIVSAYLNICRAQDLVRLNHSSVGILEQQVTIAQARLAAGVGTRTDVANAQSSVAQAQSSLAAAQQQLYDGKAALSNLIGYIPKSFPWPGLPSNLPTSQDHIIGGALLNEPNLVAALYDEQAALADLRAAEAGLRPSATLQGQLQQSWDGSDYEYDNSTTGASVTANLSVPLYQGGTLRSRVRQAMYLANSARVLVEHQRRTAHSNGYSAWSQLSTSQQQISSSRSQVRAASVTVEGANAELDAGTKTFVDLLNAQRNLIQARINLSTSQINYIVSGYNILSAMGLLNAHSLNLNVNETFNAREDFQAVQQRAQSHDPLNIWMNTWGDN